MAQEKDEDLKAAEQALTEAVTAAALGEAAGEAGGRRVSVSFAAEEQDPGLMNHVYQLTGQELTLDEVPRAGVAGAEDVEPDWRRASAMRAEYRLASAEAEIEHLRHEKGGLEDSIKKLKEKLQEQAIHLKVNEERRKTLERWKKRHASQASKAVQPQAGDWEDLERPTVHLKDAMDLKITKSLRSGGKEITFNVAVTLCRVPKSKLVKAGFDKQVDEFMKEDESKKKPVMKMDHGWMNLFSEWNTIRNEIAQPSESRTPSPRKFSPRRNKTPRQSHKNETHLKPNVVSTVSKSNAKSDAA